MKERYHISVKTVILFALSMIALIFSLIYGVRLYRFVHARELNSYTVTQVKEGDFVKITLDEFVVQRTNTSASSGIIGENRILTSGLADYRGYLISVRDIYGSEIPDAYAEVFISDHDFNWERYDFFQSGQYRMEEPYVFYAKVHEIQSADSLIQKYSNENMPVVTPYFTTDKVVQNVTFFQQNKLKYQNLFSSFLTLQFVLFLLASRSMDILSGYSDIEDRLKLDGELRVDAIYGAQLRLDHEYEMLQKVEMREKDIVKWAKIGGVLVVINLFLLIFIPLARMGTLPLLLLVFGLCKLCIFFLNSENEWALKFASRFTLDTVFRQKCRILENIRQLKESMANEKEKEQQKEKERAEREAREARTRAQSGARPGARPESQSGARP